MFLIRVNIPEAFWKFLRSSVDMISMKVNLKRSFKKAFAWVERSLSRACLSTLKIFSHLGIYFFFLPFFFPWDGMGEEEREEGRLIFLPNS